METSESKAGILITGANGLIGAELCKRLSDEHPVIALVRSTPAEPLEKVQYLPCDLSERDFTHLIPAGAIGAIVHLAQSEHFRRYPERAEDIFEVNVTATFNLIEWARRNRIGRFVYASSGGVYGFGERQFEESHPLGATDELGFYIGTKRMGEIIVENYTAFMTVQIIRPFFVYGPRQNTSMLIPRLVQKIIRGGAIQLQGENGIQTNPIFVDDAVAAIMAALVLEESHKFNIGGPEVLTLRRIAEIIGKIVGKKPLFTLDVNATPKHLIADVNKMCRLLTAPVVTFPEGVRRVVEEGQYG